MMKEGGTIDEPYEQWLGLEYVWQRGIPDRPPPRLEDVSDAVILRRSRNKRRMRKVRASADFSEL